MTNRQEHEQLIEMLQKQIENRSLASILADVREAAFLVLRDDPYFSLVDDILAEAEDVARDKII